MIRQGQQWPCLFSVECTCNQGGGGYLEDEFISAAKLIPEPNRSPMTQDWGYGFRSGLKEGKPDYDGFPKATGVVENYSAGACSSIRRDISP
jgi:hypothetical protein